MNKSTVRSAALALMALASVGASSAATVTWTDWTSLTNGQTSAAGTMGAINVSVSAGSAMNGVTQLGGPCTNYWTEPNAADKPYTGGSISNGPTACEQIGLNTANRITVNFSSAVSTLYMALLSVGQPGLAVTYDFDQAFVIDSEGQGFWGNDATNGIVGPGDTLTMREFHGVLRFNAPVTSVSFTTAPGENWHAYTFGMAPNPIPNPGTLALVGAALLAGGWASRRRRMT